MKNYTTVLFDLDGTITDPGLGITNSVAYALEKFGIEVADRTELYKFIGPPLYESFEKFYGLSHEDALKAVDIYREYYRPKGIFECFVYDGIVELLQRLKSEGKTVIVATSKPEEFAKQIMDHFDLTQYFTYIAGATMDGSRILKADIIDYALKSCGVTDLSGVVMVGDREHDVLGAKKIGVDSIGVLFGYGDRAEHETAGATYIAETPHDIGKFID